MKDFYNILGTDANCSQDEIRTAYKKLSLKLHPKLYQTDGFHQGRYDDVREAFETLNDPGRRMSYDDALKRFRSYNPQALPETPKLARVTRSIDIGFSLTLIVLTLIFGDYVYKSLYTVKTVDIVKHPAVAPIAPLAQVTVKHHKKKHSFKLKDTASYYTGTTPLSKPVAVADTDAAAPGYVLIAVDKKENLYEKRDNTASGSLVNTYVSTIKPNVTGVVYMRSRDSYNSDVVEKIPANASVTVLKKGDVFYQVMYNHVTGYVPKWTVQVK